MAPYKHYKITAIHWPGWEVVDALNPKILYTDTAWIVFDRDRAPAFSPDHVIRAAMVAGPFVTSEECHQWMRSDRSI